MTDQLVTSECSPILTWSLYLNAGIGKPVGKDTAVHCTSKLPIDEGFACAAISGGETM